MLRLSTTFQATVAAATMATGTTAWAGPERIREVPQSCTVISQEALQEAGKSPSVTETLKALPTAPNCVQSPVAAQTATNLSPFERDMLDAQNAVRSKFGVPPLQWRPDLAQGATGRAQQMAAAHMVIHAPRDGRGTIRENILRVPNSYSTSQSINRWTQEAADFVPGTFPNVCKSGGDCSGVWHFSQIAWPTTFYVGCGEASDGAFTYAACWYDKGGNKDGEQVGTQQAAADGYTLWNENNATGEFPDIDWTKSQNPKYCSAALLGGIAFNFGCNLPTVDDVLDVDDLVIPLPADANDVDTTVDQPQLPQTEVFKPEPPKTPLDVM